MDGLLNNSLITECDNFLCSRTWVKLQLNTQFAKQIMRIYDVNDVTCKLTVRLINK